MRLYLVAIFVASFTGLGFAFGVDVGRNMSKLCAPAPVILEPAAIRAPAPRPLV